MPTMAATTDDILTVAETAGLAKCSPKTIYRAIQSGALVASGIGRGRSYRITQANFWRWMDGSVVQREVKEPGRPAVGEEALRAARRTRRAPCRRAALRAPRCRTRGGSPATRSRPSRTQRARRGLRPSAKRRRLTWQQRSSWSARRALAPPAPRAYGRRDFPPRRAR